MTRKIFFTALAVLLTLGLSMAQVPTGRIIGKVTDAEGAPLPGVSVTCDSTRMVGIANAVTDETGTYRLFSLPSGTYSVRFNLPGFKTLTRRDIIVQLEQTITLNVQLEQSAIAEEITVVGQSPLIDVKSTTKGATMTKEVFMQLPRNRDFTGLLSTVPGVQYEGNQGGLSVDGASGTENMFYIDGTNVNDVHSGRGRAMQQQSIVMEQLDEVKVTASGYSAEFGGSMGGVVNVISRSGGNEFHGDLFGYYNNNRLYMQGKDRDYARFDPYAAAPYTYSNIQYISNDTIYFNGGKDRDDYQRFEGVFNLGGFVFKDKLWFFGSFNPTYSRTYGDRWFRSDPADQSQAKVWGDTIADPRQGRPMYSGFYEKRYYTYWQAKLTAAPFKGLRIAVSTNNNFSWYRGSIPSIAGTSSKAYSYFPDWESSPANTKGKQPGFAYPNWSGNANIDYTVSNNFLINLRGGFFRQNTTDQQLFVPGSQYAFSNTPTIYPEIVASRPDLIHDSGWNNGAGTTVTKKYILERASANLDLSYYFSLAGEHAVKGGFQYIRLHENVDSGPKSPLVGVYWGQTSYDIPGKAIGVAGDEYPTHGYYGYYIIRNDFISAYGSNWNIASNNWAFYLQDSWTIGQKLTLNFGVRNESEYVPALDPEFADFKPIQFGFLSSNSNKSFGERFFEKFAPRLGVVYDFFGDSSLKLFASYGVYYDVMKLYMAEGAYGGFRWWSSYYSLDDYDFTKIAASGDISNKVDQAAAGKYYGSRNWRTTSWDYTDPLLKPVAQSEVTFGAEKKLTEELSFSARFVYKHMIRTIEDVGVLVEDESGNWSEQYYIANPGEGWTRPIGVGTGIDAGRFNPDYWECPKPKREYLGLNLALEKRFSNNWQGGFNYTWSRMTGNYGGLSSSDEGGRNSPNVERYWDLYFERYDLHGRPLDGVLPSDRTHYFKAFGSYAFPFGLTVGVVAYGRSGLPRNTSLSFNSMSSFPDGYYDTGKRLPFLFNADLYLEYNLRIAKKYTINLNATIYNCTNTSTITSYYDRANYTQLRLSDTELLAQKTSYVPWQTYVQTKIQEGYQFHPMWVGTGSTSSPNPIWTGRYGAWSARVGARFSF